MKNITISKIEPANPVLLFYIDKIKSWDKEGELKLFKGEQILPFYALYYNAKLFGAGTIEFDKEKSKVKVSIVNGGLFSNNILQTEAISGFENIVDSEYDANNIEFSYIKKRG